MLIHISKQLEESWVESWFAVKDSTNNAFLNCCLLKLVTAAATPTFSPLNWTTTHSLLKSGCLPSLISKTPCSFFLGGWSLNDRLAAASSTFIYPPFSLTPSLPFNSSQPCTKSTTYPSVPLQLSLSPLAALHSQTCPKTWSLFPHLPPHPGKPGYLMSLKLLSSRPLVCMTWELHIT